MKIVRWKRFSGRGYVARHAIRHICVCVASYISHLAHIVIAAAILQDEKKKLRKCLKKYSKNTKKKKKRKKDIERNKNKR